MTAGESTSFALLITSDHLGKGSNELGAKLMHSFLDVLGGPRRQPQLIGLLNGAVRLACDGSGQLPFLELLAASGTRILVCTTCLNHYRLMDHLRVGEVSTMPVIVDELLASERCITL